MRPDRIVIGEVRGDEAFELTRAVNAGCGFACAVHTNFEFPYPLASEQLA